MSAFGDRTTGPSARPGTSASAMEGETAPKWKNRPQSKVALDIGSIESCQDLVSCLHTVLSSRLPPPLGEVIKFHAAKPHFKSIRSYNIVLAYAYRLSDFKAARRLLSQMREERFSEKIAAQPSLMGNTNSPEEEFREVIFRGVWSRGGAGRGTEFRMHATSTSGELPPSQNPVEIFGAQAAGEPMSPSQRPFYRGSIMDRVYRSVRILDPSRESNDKIKQILLDSKVEPQLGVQRRAGRLKQTPPDAAAPAVIEVAVVRPKGRRNRLSRLPEISTRPGSHGATSCVSAAPEHRSPVEVRQTASEPILPWSIARVLLGSPSMSPTPDLFLAYVKYSLNSPSSKGSFAAKRSRIGLGDGLVVAEDTQIDSRTIGPFPDIPSITTRLEQLLDSRTPESSDLSAPQGDVSEAILLRLLHLYLQPHLAARFPPQATIEAFQAALHVRGRQVRPTPRTLTYALSALRRQRARNLRALQLVNLFISNWGEQSVGIVSWRLLAKYGYERRCRRSVLKAKAGLWQWSESYRTSRARSRSFRSFWSRKEALDGPQRSPGNALKTSETPAGQIRWRLPYIGKNLYKWRRMIPGMRKVEHSRKLHRVMNRRVNRLRKRSTYV